MIKLDYPQTDAHIEAHNRFRQELGSLVETQDNMDKTLQEALSHFLSKWLNLHICGIDKELEAFILKSSVK